MKIQTLNDQDLDEMSIKIAKSLSEIGLIGPCNLQAKFDVEEGFVFFEINARFTGITPVRAVMGFNEVIAVYDYFVSKTFDPNSLNYSRNQCAYRYLSESVFLDSDIHALDETGQWPKSF